MGRKRPGVSPAEATFAFLSGRCVGNGYNCDGERSMRLRGRSLEIEPDVEDEQFERVVQEKAERQQRETDGDLVEKRRDVNGRTDCR